MLTSTPPFKRRLNLSFTDGELISINNFIFFNSVEESVLNQRSDVSITTH